MACGHCAVEKTSARFVTGAGARLAQSRLRRRVGQQQNESDPARVVLGTRLLTAEVTPLFGGALPNSKRPQFVFADRGTRPATGVGKNAQQPNDRIRPAGSLPPCGLSGFADRCPKRPSTSGEPTSASERKNGLAAGDPDIAETARGYAGHGLLDEVRDRWRRQRSLGAAPRRGHWAACRCAQSPRGHLRRLRW